MVVNFLFVVGYYFCWVVMEEYQVEIGVVVQFLIVEFIVVDDGEVVFLVIVQVGWQVVVSYYLFLCLLYYCIEDCFGKSG